MLAASVRRENIHSPLEFDDSQFADGLDLDQGNSALVSSHDSFILERSTGPRSGVVNFLFLVDGKVSHEDIWQSYFSQAHHGSFRIFVHCTQEQSGQCYGDVFASLPDMVQVPTVPTSYCDDLVSAMARLLESALEASAPPGATEKFVFVSDTTLPAKPFAHVHRALSEDPEASDICVHPSDHWGRAVVDGVEVRLVKTSQWVTLSRAHGEAFVEAWREPIDPGERAARGFANSLLVPLRGDTWAGQDRSLVAGAFERDLKTGVCTDEWAWFAKIFGAFQPGEAGERSFAGFGTLRDNSAEAQGRCDTFVFQGKKRNWQGQLAEPVIAAAEADPEQSRGRYGVDEVGNAGFESRGSHPLSFLSLGNATLEALRRSSFLFARRFPEASRLPYYADIVFREATD